jgi:hypothetical protein
VYGLCTVYARRVGLRGSSNGRIALLIFD